MQGHTGSPRLWEKDLDPGPSLLWTHSLCDLRQVYFPCMAKGLDLVICL